MTCVREKTDSPCVEKGDVVLVRRRARQDQTVDDWVSDEDSAVSIAPETPHGSVAQYRVATTCRTKSL